MTEERKSSGGILDTFFDGAEAIVGGIEKSKELADPYPDDNIEDAEFSHTQVSVKPKLIWAVDKEIQAHHLFEGFSKSSICGRFFDSNQLDARRTEIGDGNFKCCGGCLRILHSRYQNA